MEDFFWQSRRVMFTALATGSVAAAALTASLIGCADDGSGEYNNGFGGYGRGYNAPFSSPSNANFQQQHHSPHCSPGPNYVGNNNYGSSGSQPALAWFSFGESPRGFATNGRTGYNAQYPNQPAMKPAWEYGSDWHRSPFTIGTEQYPLMGMMNIGDASRTSMGSTGFLNSSTFMNNRPRTPDNAAMAFGPSATNMPGIDMSMPQIGQIGMRSPGGSCRCGRLLCDICKGRK